MHQTVIVSPPPPYLCYVGVFLLATTARKGVSTKRERERETPLIRRRRRMRFNIGWPGRERSARRRFVVSVGYTYGRSLVSLTNVSAIPRARLLLEGRRHPLTRDSAVSVTREPNLIPSHPCSRRPWRPFNYWRTCFRLVIAYYLNGDI